MRFYLVTLMHGDDNGWDEFQAMWRGPTFAPLENSYFFCFGALFELKKLCDMIVR